MIQAKIIDLQTNKTIDISEPYDNRENGAIWIFNKLRSFMTKSDIFEINFVVNTSRYLIKKTTGEILDIIGLIFEVESKEEEDLI